MYFKIILIMFGSWKILRREKNVKENYFYMFDW